MLAVIDDVLGQDAWTRVQALFANGRFVDGASSAGADASQVKRNEELQRVAADGVDSLLLGPLTRHPVFQAAAMPLRVTGATVARYGEGMRYGPHTDNPIMGADTPRLRCDIAITVFLNDHSEYDGGALALHGPTGTQRIRGNRGSAVIYPASWRHEVEMVTRGERRVVVAWVQSLVRSAERRQLLYDLWCARDTLRDGLPNALVTGEIDKVYTGLVRMWSDL
jgi:PKHD-type hydroxylase